MAAVASHSVIDLSRMIDLSLPFCRQFVGFPRRSIIDHAFSSGAA